MLPEIMCYVFGHPTILRVYQPHEDGCKAMQRASDSDHWIWAQGAGLCQQPSQSLLSGLVVEHLG